MTIKIKEYKLERQKKVKLSLEYRKKIIKYKKGRLKKGKREKRKKKEDKNLKEV